MDPCQLSGQNDPVIRMTNLMNIDKKTGQSRFFQAFWFRAAALVLAAIICVAGFIIMYGDDILNGYVKGKAELAFAKEYPGGSLRIGELNYNIAANRLVVLAATINTTNATLKAGRITLTGIRWARLLWGKSATADLLAKASLGAENLDMEFPRSHYAIRCARLRASAPASELMAEGISFLPLIADEAIFAQTFRTTRFRVLMPECRVSGLDYGELFKGKSYRAGSISIIRPSFDALVDRYKPLAPFVKSPLMPLEALAKIPKPLQVDSLGITNGHLKYSEQVAPGAAPGVLTISTVNISVQGIANQAKAPAAIQLRMQGNLMDAGLIKVLMTIPLASREFSLNYSGSLGEMDLTRLDAFLSIAEHLRIKSGRAQEVTFKIDVTGGQAHGRVKAVYKDLKIAVRDELTGSERGLKSQFASFLMNTFKVQDSKGRDAAGIIREAEVKYTRKPEDEFLQFVWFALRSGILTVISF